jgi:hypothetical protein
VAGPRFLLLEFGARLTFLIAKREVVTPRTLPEAMTEKELLVDHERWYTLLEDENGLLLAVVCGGVAMFEVRIRLTEGEAESYRKQGKPYLDDLARSVAYAPDRYRERWVPASG